MNEMLNDENAIARKTTNTLAGKIFIASALVILITLVTIGANSYWQARQAIESQVHSHVTSVLSERRVRLEAWLGERRHSLESFLRLSVVRDVINNLTIQPDASTGEVAKSLIEMLASHREAFPNYLYCGLYHKDGSLMGEAGHLEETAAPFELPVVQRALSGHYSTGSIHVNRAGYTVINLAAPFVDPDGEVTAIYLCQLLTSTSLDPILTDTIGLGMSGESFLVGADTSMLTPSRFHQHPDPLTHKMPIPTVLAALQGRSGVMVYRGFLGKEVVGAYTWLPEQQWALITELVKEEAFAPLRVIARNIAITALGALILMLIAAEALSRTWTRPIERIANASLKVAGGDLTVHVPDADRSDEIGTLAQQFNRMISSLDHSRLKLKQSHERLLQSEKLAAIGQLATGIVHEMRNPLSVIKMNLRLLQRKLEEETDTSPVDLEQIVLSINESDRLERMLTELLDYSKPLLLEFESLSALEVLRNSINSLEEIASNSGVTIEMTIDDVNDIKIWADEDIMARLILNLLSNAIQASNPGDNVIVSCTRNYEAGVIFQVRDEGSGMNPETIRRIYDPFFTTREEGIGLGMCNVRKFVEAHGGAIEIDSTVGKGTVVAVTIPESEKHA